MGGLPNFRRDDGQQMATQAECAEWLRISSRRFRELIDEGVISRADKGDYDVKSVVGEYVDNLREVAAGRGGGIQQANKADADARKANAQAEMAELKAAEMRAALVPADEVATTLHEAVTMMKTSLLSIPAKAAARVGAKDVARAEQVIRDAVVEALEALTRVDVKGPAAADA